ncbi:MAG: hypothetical protein GY820_28165 [Gammaproteobacteria bacterium]|nr:hypothetical protein [Gammaproteobacteria bacterium]
MSKRSYTRRNSWAAFRKSHGSVNFQNTDAVHSSEPVPLHSPFDKSGDDVHNTAFLASPSASQFSATTDTPVSRMPLRRANFQVPTPVAKGAFRGVSLCGHCKDIILNVLEYFENCGVHCPSSETLKACHITYRTLLKIQNEAKKNEKMDENGDSITTMRRFDIDRPIKQYNNWRNSLSRNNNQIHSCAGRTKFCIQPVPVPAFRRPPYFTHNSEHESILYTTFL